MAQKLTVIRLLTLTKRIVLMYHNDLAYTPGNAKGCFYLISPKYRLRDRQPKKMTESVVYCTAYRTDTPDRLVNILAEIFIAANSWNRSLAAYGICTCEIRCLLLQSRHSNSPFFNFLRSVSSARINLGMKGDLRYRGHQPAVVADVDSERVRDVE